MTDYSAKPPAIVTVFGANDPPEGSDDYETARTVGRTLGEMGFRVANGGYSGTMEACARGAKEAGGTTIGVICSLWESGPNPYIDEVVVTVNLSDRIRTLVDLGCGGYVVLPGATGTLGELAQVWELACRGFLGRTPDGSLRPIVCVGEYWRPLIEMMTAARSQASGLVTMIDSPKELKRYFRS